MANVNGANFSTIWAPSMSRLTMAFQSSMWPAVVGFIFLMISASAVGNRVYSASLSTLVSTLAASTVGDVLATSSLICAVNCRTFASELTAPPCHFTCLLSSSRKSLTPFEPKRAMRLVSQAIS